jgi:hypothetical protein
MSEQGYRATRQAWIDGVNKFYPGVPKQSYVLPWDEMPEWEQEAVKALYHHVQQVILLSLQASIKIPREEKMRNLSCGKTRENCSHRKTIFGDESAVDCHFQGSWTSTWIATREYMRLSLSLLPLADDHGLDACVSLFSTAPNWLKLVDSLL